MKFQISFLSIASLLLCGSVFAAESEISMVCVFPENDSIQEVLTITGEGLEAKIHIQDAQFTGDLAYSAEATEAMGELPGRAPDSVAILGNLTTQNPPRTLPAVFLIQSKVLSGNPGILQRMGGTGLLNFNCTQKD